MPRLNTEDRKYFNAFLQKAVELDPCITSPLGDLDDPVHPRFEQEKLLIIDNDGDNIDIPDNAYATMLLALRLASLLITKPALLTIFDHIANGLITGDAHGKTYIAKGSLQGTALGLEFVRCLFMHMATDYRVTYAFWDGYSTAHDTLGLQRFITQREHWRILGKSDWATDPNTTATLLTTTPDGQFMARKIQGGTSGICFRKHFIEYFECAYAHDSHAGRLAALLTFVDVLMHETTHAFAAFVHDRHGDLGRDALQPPEPRYSFDRYYQELGITWGSWFTAGVLLKPVHAQSFGGATCGEVPAAALILFEFKIADRESGCGYSIVPANKRQWTLLTADTIRMLFLKATCRVSGKKRSGRSWFTAKLESMVVMVAYKSLLTAN
jgi:hypothetical protein